MKSFFSRVAAIGMLVALPVVVLAGPVIRTGESVTITNAQEVSDDLYGAGGTVSISGSVMGDAYLAGGTVVINAPISSDLVVAGGTVQVHAPVSDDVRVGGGEVVIADTVGGDVFVIGGVLRILSTAKITGDIIFFGGELIVEGPVAGSIFGSADSARIDTSIGGSIDIKTARALTLGDRAEVLGDIAYTGGAEMVRAQNAVVVGNIQHREQETPAFSGAGFVVPILIAMFAALTAFLVFRKQVTTVVRTRGKYGVHGLIGLAALIVVPFVSLILSLSILGIYVGIFILLCYVALLIAAWVMSGIFLGTLCMEYILKKENEVSLRSVLVGTLAFQVLILIPFIGPLLAIATFLVVLGSMSHMLYNRVHTR
ncbi:hypothetical protein GW943_00900 [Candidatus Parcubacteria bacterium]|uniref:Polymer-forming cytoskeletal protein n=1 Tax=Candidatus Kaiserbacteria bacterium CG10_big_fil_rev_8_21_14_0_10_47_16 TaxID=1974608 RepID=A0A2H0UD88_9BACT|nr:hypothetical protein [Candidatus Parcubacteria bacterium]PIR84393.1 MAG: hypothetical protein COU16_02280 [Candidatus Kaiserbacteria bacterium CG10_big_fil_rev_8_21_14_0_10_47_16]